MTPDEMGKRCMAWTLGDVMGPGRLDVSRVSVASEWTGRRVVCVEPDGPRRTWCLWEGPRQVGLVRLRNPGAEDMEREGCAPEWSERMMRATLWTVEASDRTRAMLGLDDAPESRQTAPEEGSQ